MEYGARFSSSNNTYSKDKADMREHIANIRKINNQAAQGLLTIEDIVLRVDYELDKLAEYYDNPV